MMFFFFQLTLFRPETTIIILIRLLVASTAPYKWTQTPIWLRGPQIPIFVNSALQLTFSFFRNNSYTPPFNSSTKGTDLKCFFHTAHNARQERWHPGQRWWVQLLLGTAAPSTPGPLFTKRTRVLPQNPVKSPRREIGCHSDVLLWHLTGISAAVLSRCLSNVRAIGKV